jgi:hypothetical protein
MRIDPPTVQPRQAWFHLTGAFPGGKAPAGLVMLEHASNADYPNYPNPQGLDRIPDEYPPWRCVLPCFPGDREIPLSTCSPLVLKHRLWIHPGEIEENVLLDLWSAYAEPPAVAQAQ